MKFHSIVLAGGSGTRLWPLSRKKMPKQFLSLAEENALLVSTIERLLYVSESQTISVICNKDHKFLVSNQVKEAGLNDCNILVEPVPRNTAVAMCVATLDAMRENSNDETIFLTVPSDHLIKDKRAFKETILDAAEVALDGRLVTLGIKPTHPSTSFGYIKFGNQDSKVKAFVEKPDYKTAKQYIDEDCYYWNSGMFIYQGSSFLNELKKHNSKIIEFGEQSLNLSKKEKEFTELDESSFMKSPDISIDYALMEKTDKASVVELKSDWSDLGSFDQLFQVLPKDKQGNYQQGDIVNINTSNSHIYSKSRLTATIGVKDLTIIDTDDVLLISDRQNTSNEDLKKLTDKLKKKNRQEVDDNRKVLRPWGWYDSLKNEDGFQVKHICVNPKASISLQKHKHRSEHWTIVRGEGLVTVDDEKILLSENESVFIPKGAVHRLENNTNDLVEFIEVQYGTYLGEDDIERFEDIFGRE